MSVLPRCVQAPNRTNTLAFVINHQTIFVFNAPITLLSLGDVVGRLGRGRSSYLYCRIFLSKKISFLFPSWVSDCCAAGCFAKKVAREFSEIRDLNYINIMVCRQNNILIEFMVKA